MYTDQFVIGTFVFICSLILSKIVNKINKTPELLFYFILCYLFFCRRRELKQPQKLQCKRKCQNLTQKEWNQFSLSLERNETNKMTYFTLLFLFVFKIIFWGIVMFFINILVKMLSDMVTKLSRTSTQVRYTKYFSCRCFFFLFFSMYFL